MRRRIWIILGLAGAVTVLLFTSMPLWLGWALRAGARNLGLEFAHYERLGYTRFALQDVAVTTPGWRATAARLEASTPLVFLWRHARRTTQPVRIADWRVEMTPAAPAEEASAKDGPTGWVPLQEKIRGALGPVVAWLPRVEAVRGLVQWPAGAIQVPRVVWSPRGSVTADFAHRDRRGRATAVFSGGGDVTLTIDDLDAPFSLFVESRGARVSGHLAAWQQRAPFRAEFSPHGWLPETATIQASGWRIPARTLHLEDYYRMIDADVRLA